MVQLVLEEFTFFSPPYFFPSVLPPQTHLKVPCNPAGDLPPTDRSFPRGTETAKVPSVLLQLSPPNDPTLVFLSVGWVPMTAVLIQKLLFKNKCESSPLTPQLSSPLPFSLLLETKASVSLVSLRSSHFPQFQVDIANAEGRPTFPLFPFSPGMYQATVEFIPCFVNHDTSSQRLEEDAFF